MANKPELYQTTIIYATEDLFGLDLAEIAERAPPERQQTIFVAGIDRSEAEPNDLTMQAREALGVESEEGEEGEIDVVPVEFEGVTYTKPDHVQFIRDMCRADLGDALRLYQGRSYYFGPGVCVEDIADAMSETHVRCGWDNMGLGFIVHPKESDFALRDAVEQEDEEEEAYDSADGG
jgi:hypothetical protein